MTGVRSKHKNHHFSIVAPPRWRSAFSQFAPIVKMGPPVCLTFHRSRPAMPSAEFRAFKYVKKRLAALFSIGRLKA
ncbi:DUF1010 domain-containing protein [Melaminivora sp.]